MTRYQKVSMEKVLPYIGERTFSIFVPKVQQRFRVRMTGQRMELFKRTQQCVCCGVKGTHFWLECSGCFPPHFNLYATNQHGHEVMLTMDHILPRSKGGKTEENNLQLLCANCNRRKKDRIVSLDELRRKKGDT